MIKHHKLHILIEPKQSLRRRGLDLDHETNDSIYLKVRRLRLLLSIPRNTTTLSRSIYYCFFR